MNARSNVKERSIAFITPSYEGIEIGAELDDTRYFVQLAPECNLSAGALAKAVRRLNEPPISVYPFKPAGDSIDKPASVRVAAASVAPVSEDIITFVGAEHFVGSTDKIEDMVSKPVLEIGKDEKVPAAFFALEIAIASLKNGEAIVTDVVTLDDTSWSSGIDDDLQTA